LLYYTILIIFI